MKRIIWLVLLISAYNAIGHFFGVVAEVAGVGGALLALQIED